MARLHGLATLVAGMTLLLAGHVSIAAQSAGLDGAVQQGTCNRITDPVSDLTPSLLGTGEQRGNSVAIPAASSFSTIPISLDALLAGEHVVTASDPAGDIVACGEIGGTRTDAGALIIGLRPEEESAVAGIAYLAPSGNPSQTDVSLFVAGEPLADMANAQVEAVEKAADQTPETLPIVETPGTDEELEGESALQDEYIPITTCNGTPCFTSDSPGLTELIPLTKGPWLVTFAVAPAPGETMEMIVVSDDESFEKDLYPVMTASEWLVDTVTVQVDHDGNYRVLVTGDGEWSVSVSR